MFFCPIRKCTISQVRCHEGYFPAYQVTAPHSSRCCCSLIRDSYYYLYECKWIRVERASRRRVQLNRHSSRFVSNKQGLVHDVEHHSHRCIHIKKKIEPNRLNNPIFICGKRWNEISWRIKTIVIVGRAALKKCIGKILMVKRGWLLVGKF